MKIKPKKKLTAEQILSNQILYDTCYDFVADIFVYNKNNTLKAIKFALKQGKK